MVQNYQGGGGCHQQPPAQEEAPLDGPSLDLEMDLLEFWLSKQPGAVFYSPPEVIRGLLQWDYSDATNTPRTPTRVIELVRPGIARSRVCAPPHVHINSQGSRPSLCGVHNVEVLGASGTKKSRFGAWKVKSLVLAEFKLRRNAPSTHTLRWRSVRRVRGVRPRLRAVRVLVLGSAARPRRVVRADPRARPDGLPAERAPGVHSRGLRTPPRKRR